MKKIFTERNFYIAYFAILSYLFVWVVDMLLWIARYPG